MDSARITFHSLDSQRARFLRAVAVFPDAEQQRIRDALAFAERVHAGQERKGSVGIPYIIHPVRVACTLIEEFGIAIPAVIASPRSNPARVKILNRVRLPRRGLLAMTPSMDIVITGLLHDVVEDCGVAIETIHQQFGSSVGRCVAWLTFPKGDGGVGKWKQAKAMRRAPFAVRAVKAMDLLDNARDFATTSTIDRLLALRALYGYERWGRVIVETLGPALLTQFDDALAAFRTSLLASVASLPEKANRGKEIAIEVGAARRGRPSRGRGWHPATTQTVHRYPLRTPLITPTTNLLTIIRDLAVPHLLPGDILAISERIVAITQGRAYRLKDIHPSRAAKFLVRFVHKSPYGIGLGSPWTMELAIREAGLPRIIIGCIVAAITKPFGVKGMFYRVVGKNVNAIDGPCDYTLPVVFSPPLQEGEQEGVVRYGADGGSEGGWGEHYAKLGPKDPQRVAEQLAREIGVSIAIIDANDLGVTVLGTSEGVDPTFIRACFRDNPLGQTDEQTPMAIVRVVAD